MLILQQHVPRLMCTACGGTRLIKYGRVNGIQRYRCAVCGRQFLEESKRPSGKDAGYMALILFKAGVPVRMIGEMLQITAQSVYRWVNGLESGGYATHTLPAISVSSVEVLRYFVQKEKRHQARNMWVVPHEFPSGWSLDMVVHKPAFRRLPTDGEPLRVGVMGGEILKGVVFDETSGRFGKIEDNFVSLCKRRLNISVTNLAKTRSTVVMGKRYFGRYRKALADCTYVFFMFGGNDSNYSWGDVAANPDGEHYPACSLEVFREKYTALIGEAKRDGIMPVLLSLPPINPHRYLSELCKKYDESSIRRWKNANVDFLRRRYECYNLEIFNIGLQLEIPVFDITSPFLCLQNFDDLLCADGVHPNADGHRLIADAICRHVESLSPSVFSSVESASRRDSNNEK